MYSLKLKASVKKDLKRINKGDIKFIRDTLLTFAEKFSSAYEQELMQAGKIKKLKAQTDELYRLKLRSYRVIYKKEEDRLIILVVSVKSRENSYKK